MLVDKKEIISFLEGPIEQFPDRSAKWLLANPEYLREWLLTVLKEERSDVSDFRSALERLCGYLEGLSAADQGSWRQAIYYLYLLILCRRPPDEHEELQGVVSEGQEPLEFSKEEVDRMQSMAEYCREQGIELGMARGREQGREEGIELGIEQGMERGARETNVENTLTILKGRFPDAETDTLKPVLESIDDLDRLKALTLRASLVPSFRAFQDDLGA